MDSPTALWSAACASLKKTLHRDVFARWVEPIAVKGSEDGVLVLAVDNDWSKFFIEQNYADFIRAALREADPTASFRIEVDESLVAPAAAAPAPEPPRKAPPRTAAQPKREEMGMPLDANFTFENFVTGPSNSMANAAALAVADNPGGAYNPLLVYGATGLGKTHLMQAIGHAVRLKYPRSNVVYLTLEAMLNDFIESIKDQRQAEFRARYRRADVLLVDDIQFLTGKTALQEEFFNTFNALQNEHRQIVLTCDRAPKEIAGLDDRLVSRFQQGLVASIERPSFETRLAILRYKQRGAQMPLSDALLNYIAENITTNVRQLEGAIVKAVCFQSLVKKPLTIEVLAEQLQELVDNDGRADLSCQEIQRVVAEEFDVHVSDITSKERPQNVALPRQIAMYLSRQFTGKSLPEIARAFNKTHATIVHACKTIPGRMETDRSLKRRVDAIVEKLGRDPSSL